MAENTPPRMLILRGRQQAAAGDLLSAIGALEGSRPFTRKEMENMFMGPDGKPYYVSDTPPSQR